MQPHQLAAEQNTIASLQILPAEAAILADCTCTGCRAVITWWGHAGLHAVSPSHCEVEVESLCEH